MKMRLPRRSSRLSFIAAAATIAVASCRTPSDPDQTQAIREVIARTEAANNTGDVDAWVDLFEAGAVYMPPGQPAVTFRQDLSAIASAGFSNWRSDVRMMADEVVVMGDWAFGRVRVTGTATPIEGGAPASIDMKEIVIYHRQPDGAWKIARLIGNANGA